MSTQLEANKAVVLRFNKEVIEEGNVESFNAIMHEEFINQTAPPGMDPGAAGMIYTFNELFRPAFPDIQVTIFRQVAEGDLVTTHKVITGTHTGTLMGIAPTGKKISIQVMDMVRIRNGKYFEHWGVNSLPSVLAELAKG